MRRLSDRRLSLEGDSPANPMEGLGNLADAMLVLAVGIMLALILNWKVDISTPGAPAAQAPEDHTQTTVLDESALTDAAEQEMDPEDLQRIGGLYYDEETGLYYAVMGDEE